jgi:type IV pilus assembly protein PilM
MLGFVQNWFGPRCSPIGVDFGSDSLRLAQVQWVGNDWRLIAAASASVPASARKDPAERWSFFTQTVRDLLVRGDFSGRSVMLGLPAADMHIQHLRMDKMDPAQLKKALPWEARGKLPIEPSRAVLRHVVAGEVYVDQEPRHEVILLATHRDTVDLFLQSAAKAKLDVIGMNIEPLAVLDCFTHIYRRAADQEVTNFFVDIGTAGARAFLTRGRQVLFARNIAIGGDHFAAAVASAKNISADEASALRIKLCEAQPVNPAIIHTTDDEASQQRHTVEQACEEPLKKLISELDLCRRYYEATFPGKPVDRMVFIGGQARHRGLCQHIARELGLAAQLGDPLCRMSKTCQLGPESGIDRRLPQPAWAVAIGLSMGPPAGDLAAASAAPQESRRSHERA